jgi:hypothetical protein
LAPQGETSDTIKNLFVISKNRCWVSIPMWSKRIERNNGGYFTLDHSPRDPGELICHLIWFLSLQVNGSQLMAVQMR